jgi:hypothetical protein
VAVKEIPGEESGESLILADYSIGKLFSVTFLNYK